MLLWVGLVGSHLIAFTVTTSVHAPPRRVGPGVGHLPLLPSLAPMGAAPGGPQVHGEPPPGMPPPAGAPLALREPPDSTGGPGGIPATALWRDDGVRFPALGVVAQFDAQALLMAAISHDLRTALARLRMRIEMMEAQPQSER